MSSAEGDGLTEAAGGTVGSLGRDSLLEAQKFHFMSVTRRTQKGYQQ
jgi:hypothetical protein